MNRFFNFPFSRRSNWLSFTSFGTDFTFQTFFICATRPLFLISVAPTPRVGQIPISKIPCELFFSLMLMRPLAVLPSFPVIRARLDISLQALEQTSFSEKIMTAFISLLYALANSITLSINATPDFSTRSTKFSFRRSSLYAAKPSQLSPIKRPLWKLLATR